MDIKASNFPEVYENLGIDINDLGCIMVNVEPFELSDIILQEDLYNPEGTNHAMGLVGETAPHCTLLYGLLNDGNAMRKNVDLVLSGWELNEVEIGSVDYFDGVDNETGMEYYCIVAKLVPSSGLVEANARLKMLPHLDTFPMQYIPHCSLAYVVHDEAKRDQYVKALNTKLVGSMIPVVGLNYGD